MTSKVKYVSTQTYKEEVLESQNPVLVDFYADWCGPCKMLSPVIDQLANEYDNKVSIVKVNIDENNSLASQAGVMSIPTLVLYRNGKEVKRLVGAHPKSELSKILDGLE